MLGSKTLGKFHADHSELWLISYADIMTLLFGFFVILYSLSQVDEKRFSTLGKQLSESLSGQKQQSQADSNPGVTMAERRTRALQLLVALLHLNSEEEAIRKIEKMGAEQSSLNAAGQAMAEMAKDKSALAAFQPTVEQSSDRIEIVLPDSSLFRSGTAALTPQAQQAIRRVAMYINRLSGNTSMEIVGHTDSAPANRTGLYTSNWSLSAARAGAVAEELIRDGVNRALMSTRGMADLQPLFPERAANGALIPENMSRNRRVQIIVKKAANGSPKTQGP